MGLWTKLRGALKIISLFFLKNYFNKNNNLIQKIAEMFKIELLVQDMVAKNKVQITKV